MQIPFHKPHMSESEILAVTECLHNGWLTMGQKTHQFEQNFNKYLNAKESIAVSSCTAALHLSLCAINLKKDDEVIIPTTTFVATAEVISYFNAKPILVDIDKETHLIDVSKIEEKITKNTKAIIPVHFAGQPADMDEIISLAKKYNLTVIEDAAHALPAKYKNNYIGQIGDICCFSFYATKTLASGEGGMITTSNPEWAERMRILRLHGLSRDAWKRYNKEGSWKYDVEEMGYKYNTTDLNSAIAIEQLKRLDKMTKNREIIAQKYNKVFEPIEELITYKIKSDRTTAWHLYPLKLNLNKLRINRDQFIVELNKKGISTSVHFIPLYEFTYFKKIGFNKNDYPNSNWVYDRVISLPIYPGMSDNEVSYVIKNILEIVETNRK